MAELLFYNRPARLNRIAHAKLRFTPLANFEFARKVTSIPLMAVEFPLACRQYPIIFVQSPEGVVVAQAVLSLAEGVNSFVDDQGRWTATYVPAFIRRYLFVLAEIPGKPTSSWFPLTSTSCGEETRPSSPSATRWLWTKPSLLG